MKRWLLRILLALLVLVLLLLSGVAAIGLTESGTRWLVRQLQPLLPGELAYADLRGRLFDRIEIDGLSYRQQALQLEAGRIEFALVPWPCCRDACSSTVSASNPSTCSCRRRRRSRHLPPNPRRSRCSCPERSDCRWRCRSARSMVGTCA
ncbi:hypothetical protein [Marinobacterium aestuariivivens]|uniref:AsmA domain-containing protein n=1 Tax=Marinobacterium aestuariivivens TaxID=1698799 RepID=A0ABW2A1H5_9GAMM